MKTKLTRRDLLTGAVGVVGVTAAQRGAAAQTPGGDPTRFQGRLANELGVRSSFETPRRAPTRTSSRTPLQELHGTITPSDLHFERHHGGVAEIDPASYTLMIHGMVDRPTIFTLDDLKRFPSVSRIHFMECSGNLRREAGAETTPQRLCGLTSQSEWTGVRLSTVFREVGAHDAAAWFLAEGQDAAVMTRSIPIEKGWNDAMIAYAQNGEALRPEQGYPVRLFNPGWEGNSSVKWLRRLELSDRPFMTREETARYTEGIRGGRVRQFSFVMDARSVITAPAYPNTVETGWQEIRGIAWSGRGRITRVEVSTDGGNRWDTADLQDPVLPIAHTRFRYMWNWRGGPAELMSRATDETGYVQPAFDELMEARGGGGYHMNPVTSWTIDAEGRVLFGIARVTA